MEAKRGLARRGTLILGEFRVRIPAFMPVATRGAIKGVPWDVVEELGIGLVIANAFHLHLRPGEDAVEAAGGLRGFAGFRGAFATDSGGFQVFSLAPMRVLCRDGVGFRSPLDGSHHFFTPEGVLELQRRLGSDLAMVLDVPVGWPAPREEAERALELTLEWARRSREHMERLGMDNVMAIVQGGFEMDLRERAARVLVEMDFPGYAVGGLALGEPREIRRRILELLAQILPEDKPRYVMGLGYPEDLRMAVELGYDLFDCVTATRTARNGGIFTSQGMINIRNSRYARDPGPLDPACDCPVCRRHSRAYIRHLFNVKDMTGPVLATIHQLRWFARFVEELGREMV